MPIQKIKIIYLNILLMTALLTYIGIFFMKIPIIVKVLVIDLLIIFIL
jgi:hypothetical protein